MKSDIQKKLDLIAKHVNELSGMLRADYGSEAHVFFEAEGSVHAMEAGEQEPDEGSAARQSRIIASSKYCRFDCGAW